jgi:hypothetical protein
MMGKKLRNLALLGGLGAAAYMMGRKKDDSKEGVDTTADASAGQAKDRLGGAGFDRGDKDTAGDMSAGQAKDRLKDLEKVTPKKPKKAVDDKPAAKAPTRTKEEPSKKTETEAEYKARMDQLQKDQALGSVNPEMYLGPGRLLGGINAAAKALAARAAKKGSDAAKTSTSRDIVPAGSTPRFLGRGPRQEMPPQLGNVVGAKKGGVIKSSASKRGDGIALRGKTRGRMV